MVPMQCWKSDHDAPNKDILKTKTIVGFQLLQPVNSSGFEALVFSYAYPYIRHSCNLLVVEHTYPHGPKYVSRAPPLHSTTESAWLALLRFGGIAQRYIYA